MKIQVDPNNGNQAKIYYANYNSELFEFSHTTRIPLDDYEIDEEEDNKDLCKALKKYVSPSSIHVDINGKEKYYFDLTLGKVVERGGWEEEWQI